MKSKFLLSTLVFCLFLSVSAFAQNSAVSGTIADPSGALVPGVTVTATNAGTGIVSTTVSNETGSYNFASLQPGSYKMSASLPGFQTQTFSNYDVGGGVQLRLNFTLKLAGAQTNVEVMVDASALIATSSSSIGQVLSPARVQSLPLIGPDVLQLIDIMPGVIGENFAGVPQASVNTVRDGLSVSDGRFNAGVFATTVMNPDLVGEVRLILAPVDAELGRGNGQVQITTRSGTNRFSGNATWNIKNTALNPNTWANNRNVDAATGKWSPLQPNWENNHQYSVSYGGPIVKNKTFFFALWEQQLNYQRQVVTASVMTDAAKKGIFRYFSGWNNGNANATTVSTGTNPTIAVVDFSGNPRTPATNPAGGAYTGALQCFSVFGTVKTDGSPFTAADCPGGTALLTATPWDTNRPVSDPTGYIRKILDQMPTANNFTSGDGLNRAGFLWLRTRQGNQGANVTIGNDLNANRTQINIKGDHNFNSSHKLSIGYTKEKTDTFSDVPNWPDQVTFKTKRWPQIFTSNFTSTLSASLLNEARVGMRYNLAGVDAPWEDQFGDQAVIDKARGWMVPGSNNYLALINPGAGNYAYGGGANGVMITNPGQYNGNRSVLWSYGDTLSWTRGKHGFKFGGELRRDESNGYNNSPAGGGALILYPRVSGGAGGLNSPLGNALAAIPQFLATNRTDAANMAYFLAGSMNGATQTYWINSYGDVESGTWHDTNDQSTGGRKYRPVARTEYSFFVKDDWKITRRLTLNLGARYEFYGSPYISTKFTSTVADTGIGLFGVGRSTGGIFDQWLQPGGLFLSGYGPNAAAADALKCITGIRQSAALPVSNCDPNLVTKIEFIGPTTPNPGKTAIREDRNNFGPAIGFAYQVPWFGEGKTTVRGGYQLTYGGSGRVVGGGGITSDEAVIGQAPGSLSSPTTVLADFNGQYLDLTDIPALVPAKPFSPALPGAQVPFHTRAGNFSAYDPNFVTPYTQNFTLSVNRAVSRYVNVDIQYIGTVSKKQAGSLNLNTTNTFYNKELFDAFDVTRAGGDSPLLDQMLAGLNLNSGVTTNPGPGGTTINVAYGPIGTCVVQPTGSVLPGLGQNGCAANAVLQTASAHIRRNTTYDNSIADGQYATLAAALNGNGTGLPGTGAGALLASPLTSVGGRMLRNGCDRIATGTTTVQTVSGTLPIRCFAENYITANPQVGTPTFITNTGSSNYHSMQAQVTLRPVQGFSYQATYTWSKNLGLPGAGYTDPLNRRLDYTYTGSHRGQDFRSNGSFELPIGPNKLLMGNSSGILARIVERWQTNLIFNITAGARADVAATAMRYANGVPNIVGPIDLTKGKVAWGGSTNANGQATGDYFGVGNYVKAEDPQCLITNATDRMGFNLYTTSTCGLDALADAKSGQILFRHPLPGQVGTYGQNKIELPGSWRFDANLSKSFRLSESKTMALRFDATNVLNHPQPGNPTLDINSNTEFGRITTKTGTRTFQGQLRFTF